MGNSEKKWSKEKNYPTIVNIYNVVMSKVRAGNDLTESFMSPRGLKQGKYVAQFYFLFIKELANEIMQRARPVMQLIPDVIEIFILLFADDVILVSDAACGLQNHLNVLFDTSNRLSLFVNMDKNNNKIIVFRNREHG